MLSVVSRLQFPISLVMMVAISFVMVPNGSVLKSPTRPQTPADDSKSATSVCLVSSCSGVYLLNLISTQLTHDLHPILRRILSFQAGGPVYVCATFYIFSVSFPTSSRLSFCSRTRSAPSRYVLRTISSIDCMVMEACGVPHL